MKIFVPEDYRAVFERSVRVALLSESGKPFQAFLETEFTDLAVRAASLWPFTLDDRKALLRDAEGVIAQSAVQPIQVRLNVLCELRDKLGGLLDQGFIEVDDHQAHALSQALELHSRLSLGQISDTLENYISAGPDYLNDLYHQSVRLGGHSFGITNALLSDDVRAGWYARKAIQSHLAWKANPGGGITNQYDSPARLGKVTLQEITIDDPEFAGARVVRRPGSPTPSF